MSIVHVGDIVYRRSRTRAAPAAGLKASVHSPRSSRADGVKQTVANAPLTPAQLQTCLSVGWFYYARVGHAAEPSSNRDCYSLFAPLGTLQIPFEGEAH